MINIFAFLKKISFPHQYHNIESAANNRPQTLVSDFSVVLKMSKKSVQQRPGLFKMQSAWDFPGGPSVETLGSQCRGCRFNPWSRELRSLYAAWHVAKNKEAK